ncbi:hypothetical protein ACVWZW_004808 [Bradyrhizobium sp. F1.13.4]
MEWSVQHQGMEAIPFGLWKLIQRCHKLHSGIQYKDVETAGNLEDVGDHVPIAVRRGEIRTEDVLTNNVYTMHVRPAVR